jgi:hypothetical protein
VLFKGIVIFKQKIPKKRKWFGIKNLQAIWFCGIYIQYASVLRQGQEKYDCHNDCNSCNCDGTYYKD